MESFYAVYNGKNGNKIYKSWGECQENTRGVKKCRFKKFKSFEEASNFIEENIQKDKEQERDIEFPCLFVDGSYNSYSNSVGWGFVFYSTKEDYDNGVCIALGGEIPNTNNERNFLGELEACIRGLKHVSIFGIKEVTVAHDYYGIGEFITGGFRPGTQSGINYKKIINGMINEKGMKIKFKKVKGHSKERGNDYADKICGQACRNNKNSLYECNWK